MRLKLPCFDANGSAFHMQINLVMLSTVYIRKPIRIVSRQIQLLHCFHLQTSSQNTSVKLAALWPMAFTEYLQSSCKQLSLKNTVRRDSEFEFFFALMCQAPLIFR